MFLQHTAVALLLSEVLCCLHHHMHAYLYNVTQDWVMAALLTPSLPQ